MGQETINNGETGLVVRGKLNANFTELYTSLGDLSTSLDSQITSLEGRVTTLENTPSGGLSPAQVMQRTLGC